MELRRLIYAYTINEEQLQPRLHGNKDEKTLSD
jgi:hypothetical protein